MRASSWVRCASALPVLVCLISAGAQARNAAARNPVVVELFTSEGCSSCPPVDRWVERLDSAQPLAGAQLIVLSEHVDYWDHQGWKDPFSSALLTERQRNYVRMLGLSGVYTPQVVLDGDVEVHPGDAQQATQAFHREAAAARATVSIEDAHVADGAVTGSIVVQPGSKRGDVVVAVALDRTETDVLGGENDGRKLTNVAVVLAMAKIGKTEKGKVFDQGFRVPVKPADVGNLRIVALVQEGDQGAVLGAGMVRVGSAGATGR